MAGRPTVYSDEIAQSILDKMCAGLSMREICKTDNMPARSTVMLWISTNRESFSDRYAKAYQARAYYWADEILDIADDSINDYMLRQSNGGEEHETTNPEAIARSRLRVDTRKWLMSKLIPTFADKADPTPPHIADKVITIVRATGAN
tara:strand:+ start:4780 stop:5223 length:444 start_codon:yes stop_codon:yes gene_type:complete